MNLTVQNITLKSIKDSDYFDLANIMIWGFKDYYGKHLAKIIPEFTEVKIGGKDVIKIVFPGNGRTYTLNIYKKGNVFAHIKIDGKHYSLHSDHPLKVANWFLRHNFLALNIPLNDSNITNLIK